MRPLNVSLCDETYALAKQKANFSSWVRDQLRSERNQREAWKLDSEWWHCKKCTKVSQWAKGAKYIFVEINIVTAIKGHGGSAK